MAAWVALAGMLASGVATLWFFAGFFETDPGFAPASSAALLSLGLGAFALIPCGVAARLCRTAHAQGFRVSQGLWVLFLFLPWAGLAHVAGGSDWLPGWLGAGALLVAVPLLLWAGVSLSLEAVRELRRARRR
ncbi:MAG: hypothetical protein WBG08_05930 [Litorimonas sp.]